MLLLYRLASFVAFSKLDVFDRCLALDGSKMMRIRFPLLVHVPVAKVIRGTVERDRSSGEIHGVANRRQQSGEVQ